jgi:hypothetical protein
MPNWPIWLFFASAVYRFSRLQKLSGKSYYKWLGKSPKTVDFTAFFSLKKWITLYLIFNGFAPENQ